MKRILKIFLLPLLPMLFTGCIYLAVAGFGALGGYIVSPDTVEGTTGAEIADVWKQSVDIVSIMGLIEEKSEAGGLIKAKVEGAEVTIMITSVGPSTVKLSVKSRKHYLPKVSLSQDIYVKIMSRVKE